MNTAHISPETAQLHALLLLPMDGITEPNPTEIKHLLWAGADINAPDSDGLTPLLRCLSWTYADIFRPHSTHVVLSLLLSLGADLNATTPYGTTAQTLASRWDDDRFASDKLSCEALRRSDPFLMAMFNQIDASWVKPGAPVTEALKRSFIAACYHGVLEEVRYIVHFYPDAVNWEDNTWLEHTCTGLMAAVVNGECQQPDVPLFLLTRGANVNWQNNIGMTALHHAVCEGGGSDEDLIDPLVQAGANEKLENNEGWSVVALAQEQDNPAYAMLLTAALEKREAARRAQQESARLSIDAVSRRRLDDGRKFKL